MTTTRPPAKEGVKERNNTTHHDDHRHDHTPAPGPARVVMGNARAIRAMPVAVALSLLSTPTRTVGRTRRGRDDERGAISVEQFAWIGIALFLIVAAAVALKVYWGEVNTFVTSSWDSITGTGTS